MLFSTLQIKTTCPTSFALIISAISDPTTMPTSVRTKRATGPLSDKVRAQLVGKHVTRGSDRCGDSDDSSTLSDLVHGFLGPVHVETLTSPRNNHTEHHDTAESTSCPLPQADADDDPIRAQLLSCVSAALSQCPGLDWNRPVLRRRVMAFLRDLGHDAAICKTSWPKSENVASGNYEFIDVVESKHFPQIRYVIDLDFADQFEIARPSDSYSSLLQSLPRLYVGKTEDLRRIVEAMCGEARRSLKSRGLHFPPWRKSRFVQNKWLGPHRRMEIPTPPLPLMFAVKCHSSVWFDAARSDVFGPRDGSREINVTTVQ